MCEQGRTGPSVIAGQRKHGVQVIPWKQSAMSALAHIAPWCEGAPSLIH